MNIEYLRADILEKAYKIANTAANRIIHLKLNNDEKRVIIHHFKIKLTK